MHSSSLRSRGFTLIELLVGTVVGSIVLLGISMTFISQAQQYQSHASRRAIQASARQSLAFMERKVRSSGYGVHPDRAVLAYDSYDVVSDSSLPGYPDAIVVHSRDPLFRRRLQNAAATQLTLSNLGPALTQPLRRGQILLALCTQEPKTAFVTVSQDVPAGATVIPLDQNPPAADSPVREPGALFREQARLTDACFAQAWLVKIDRFGFYVAMFDEDGDLATSGSVPYLMMNQGLDLTGDGSINAEDSVPVAEGIEQLQIAYILNVNNPAALNEAPIILGVEGAMPANHYGELWQGSNALINTTFVSSQTPPIPWFFDTDVVGATHAFRRADHPANIRQIRLTLVARSTVSDQQITGDNMMTGAEGAPLPGNNAIPWRQLENLDTPVPDFTPSGGGYYRVLIRESITPKNLLMNAQFSPVEFEDSAETVLTAGGG
ncbi:MAG TPA: prepilin-type N-terminal cleavage/methylation domain-containing protein [Myxococcaceae bacterium]|jgi:type IV pilus assembly protein PilW